MIGSRLIKSNNTAAGCEDIVDAYDPFAGNGLALYQLNGNANDVSGNYNGTATAVTYGTGVFGQAGVFNGSTSGINLGNGLVSSLTALSTSVWFNTDNISLNAQIILDLGYSSTGNGLQIFIQNGGNIVYRVNNGGSNVFQEIINGVISNNTWYNIIATFENTILGAYKLYLNNSLIASGNSSQTSSISFASTGLYLGHYNQTFSRFDGSIDQVRIFNEALTPLEVEALYIEESCICGGTVDTLDILDDSSCIALYPLDGNANDLSGNYSGTPTNVSYGVGEFDLAGVFNGSNSIITNTSQVVPSGAASISFWYNNNGNGGTNWIIGNGVATSSKGLTFAYGTDNKFYFFIFKGVTNSALTIGTTNTFTNNVWNYISASWDGTTNTNSAKLYVNGDLEAEGTPDASSASIGAYTTFGIGGIDGGGYAAGSIDQVRIFNKALSPEDVTTLYDETACTYTPAYEPIIEDSTDPFGDGSEYALYEFDNNVIDSEGSYNGLASGSVAYTTGVFGQAINLTGTNASVEIPNFSTSDFSNKNVSVSAWVNMQSLTTGASSKGAHLFTAGSGSWAISVSQSGIGFAKYLNGSNNYSLKDTTPVNLNEWYHIVATDSTSTGMKIYVNGIIVASVNYTGAIDLTYNDIGWGYYNDYQDRRGFTGYVDQGRIFNKTLTASEVYALYNE